MSTRLLSPRWGIALVALGWLGLATACGEPGSGPQISEASSATQTNEAGQVKIAATWQGVTGKPDFTVTMDTHSVDLDGYDLDQLALLRTDDGRQVRPSGWDAPSGGHHRSGTLSFPTTADDGRPLIGPTTRTLELVIADVAGVPERVLRWAL